MNKVQKIFVIFAFLAISSQCLPSGSTNLFHKFANTPNHIMVTVTLDYALDSPYYLASLDLTNVAGITLFRSGAYGECSVRSGSSVSNILQAHLSNFVRVPCFNIGNVLSVPLTELSLLGSNSFQIIIKDISFANK